MVKTERFVLGVALTGISAAFFLTAAGEALPQEREEVGVMRSEKGVQMTGQPMLVMTSPQSGLRVQSRLTVTDDDLRQIADQHLVHVAGPAEATPEQLVETIIADAGLPSRIREPFVKLAERKAPYLLDKGRGITLEVAQSQ